MTPLRGEIYATQQPRKLGTPSPTKFGQYRKSSTSHVSYLSQQTTAKQKQQRVINPLLIHQRWFHEFMDPLTIRPILEEVLSRLTKEATTYACELKVHYCFGILLAAIISMIHFR